MLCCILALHRSDSVHNCVHRRSKCNNVAPASYRKRPRRTRYLILLRFKAIYSSGLFGSHIWSDIPRSRHSMFPLGMIPRVFRERSLGEPFSKNCSRGTIFCKNGRILGVTFQVIHVFSSAGHVGRTRTISMKSKEPGVGKGYAWSRAMHHETDIARRQGNHQKRMGQKRISCIH